MNFQVNDHNKKKDLSYPVKNHLFIIGLFIEAFGKHSTADFLC